MSSRPFFQSPSTAKLRLIGRARIFRVAPKPQAGRHPIERPRFNGRTDIWISFRPAWISFRSIWISFQLAWISFLPAWNSFRPAWNRFLAAQRSGRALDRLLVPQGGGRFGSYILAAERP